MIEIVVNDQTQLLTEGTTLAQLIEQLTPASGTVAAVNETFVPRSRRAGHVLQARDRVELLAPMEGG
jgi:sulfur carrier protein